MNKLKSFLAKAPKINSLEVIWGAHVRHPSVVVISQVWAVARTLVKQIICPLLCPKVSEENVNGSLFYTWCFISDTLSVLWWRVGCWIADFVRLKSDCWGCNASSYQEPWVAKYAKVRRYICLGETHLFGLRIKIVSVEFLRVIVVIPTSKTVNWIPWLGLNVPGKYFKMNFL